MSFEKEFQHLQLHIPLKDIKLATNNFGNDHCIGRGGFGKVYSGELLLSCGLTMVAIKRLDSTLGQGAPEFWKEILMLSRYKHENIVSLLGFCNESGESILVYEYLSNKSLDLYLRSTDLSWNQRLRICIGAARGLQYLHDPNGTQQRLLHRDIKSANILLDQNWNAKISDFGLSKVGPANQQYTFLVSNAVGTFGYIDPLYRKTGCLTKESDIYSFGVVLFEVLCGRFCIENYEDDRRFLEVLAQRCYQEKKVDTIIKSDLKGQISQECLERFSTIAYQCLQEDRTKRPLIAEIVKELQIALQYQIPVVEIKIPKVEIKRTFNHICGTVDSVDLHPTRPWVLLGLHWGNAYIWNYHSRVMEKSFRISNAFGHVAKFIERKKWIVVGASDGFIGAYNYNTMKTVVELRAHKSNINCVLVHPSLPYVLSASDETLIKLWNWENDWECVRTFNGHTSYVKQITFNPRDTNVFVSASNDGTIKTWNIGHSSPRSSIECNQSMCCAVEFLNTDEKLYLVSLGQSSWTAEVWDYESGTCVQILRGHTGFITSILCVHSSNVNYIITGSEDGSVCVWNAKTYNSEHVFASELDKVWTMGFKKFSAQIVLGCDKGAMIGQVISTHSLVALQNQFALQNQIPTGEIKRIIVSHIPSHFYSIELHPTEPWVLLGPQYDQKVYIWNFHSHAMEKCFGFAKSLVYKAKFIAQKKWIVVGDTAGFIRAYNYDTAESVVELQAHTRNIWSLVVHPSLPYILSASSDMLIKLWNWENDWECIQTFEGHTRLVMQVAFNPRDTNVFASASLDCTIKTWNIGYSSPRSSIEADDVGLICVEFLNTDEKLYLVSESRRRRTVKVWDYETGTCVQTLQDHTSGVTSILCVHSDVCYIITGSYDGTVRVWNAKTYDLEHVFTSELGKVHTIRFKKDSSQIILGCEKGVVIGQLISTTLENVPQPPHTTLEETSSITTERHP